MAALLRALAALPLALPLAAAQCSDLTADFSAFLALQDGTGGGVLRIQHPGLEAFSITGGTLKKGSSTAFTASTTFEVASVTKSLVSALVLRKVAEGATTLETTATSILGAALPSRALVVGGVDLTSQITLRQLLAHTSGLASFWNGNPKRAVQDWYTTLGLTAPTTHPAWATYATFEANRFQFEGIARAFLEPAVGPTRIWTPAEVLAFLPGYDSLTPGSYSDSDSNFVILGLVVEQLYGKSLNEAIQQDLFAPLTGAPPLNTYMRYDMSASPPADTAPIGTDRYAVLAHRYSDVDPVAGTFDLTMTDAANFPNAVISSYYYSADWASGGLVSNAEELARVLVGLVQSSAAPWTTVRSLLVNSVDTGRSNSYGLGIESFDTLLGHSGDGGAVMFYDVAQDVAITGTNSNNAQSMTRFVRDHIATIRACAAAQAPTATNATTNATAAATTRTTTMVTTTTAMARTSATVTATPTARATGTNTAMTTAMATTTAGVTATTTTAQMSTSTAGSGSHDVPWTRAVALTALSWVAAFGSM